MSILDPTLDPPVWTTQDGRKIALPEMADDHLGNALVMLARRANAGRHGTADHVLSLMAFDVLNREIQRRPGLPQKVRAKLLQSLESIENQGQRHRAGALANAAIEFGAVALPRFRHLAPKHEELN